MRAAPTLGNPELQLGPSSSPLPSPANLGWYRRFLPHRDDSGLIQFITYRLADSLPQAALDRLESELAALPPERMEPERRRRIEAWLDAGHGSCVLRDPAAAQIVVEAWRHFDGERYDLLAWVVMPNHVHVLARCIRERCCGRLCSHGRVLRGEGYWRSWIRPVLEHGVPRSVQPKAAVMCGCGNTGIGSSGMKHIS